MYTEETLEKEIFNFLSGEFFIRDLTADQAGLLEAGFRLLWDKLTLEEKTDLFTKYIAKK